MPKEVISIKTLNGKVIIDRTETKATITEERTCYGFKETSVIKVEKLDSSCIHYAWSSEADLITQYKNN